MKDHTINRRDLMKTAVAGAAAGALGVLGGRKVGATSTDTLRAAATARR